MSGIKRYEFRCADDDYMERPDGSVVLYTDHLASHAYDEAVERAAFEAEYPDLTKKRSMNAQGVYWSAMTQNRWVDWVRCAKSRAKRAGGDA